MGTTTEFQVLEQLPDQSENTKQNWVPQEPQVSLSQVHMAICRIASSHTLIKVHNKQGPNERVILLYDNKDL